MKIEPLFLLFLNIFYYFGYSQQFEFAQNSFTFCQSGLKFLSNTTYALKSLPQIFKVCPSVEITLNLVTLVGSKVPIPAGDSLHVKDFTAETKIIIARRFRDIRLYATKVVLMVDHSSLRNGLAFSNWQTNHRYTKLTYLGRLCSPVSI